jgi:hypothetical protein
MHFLHSPKSTWPNHFLSHAPFIWDSTISRRKLREVLSPGLRRQYSSLPISSLPIPLTSIHKGSSRNLISTTCILPRSFYFMTQLPLPYTNLRVVIILYIFLFYFPMLYIVMRKSPYTHNFAHFLFYFPVLYRVTRKSTYTVLLLFQGTPEPPCSGFPYVYKAPIIYLLIHLFH